MFATTPDQLRAFSGEVEEAQAVIDAVNDGQFEITAETRSYRDLVIMTDSRFYTVRQNLPGERVNVPVGRACNYIVIAINGQGQSGIADQLRRQEQLDGWAQAEELADPEGAFGGRGNNVI